MIRLLWTKSKWPTGYLITWGLDEPCSHFAIEFFGRIIFHSNFSGVHPELSITFNKSAKIIYYKDLDVSYSTAAELMANILTNYWGKKYDWKWFFNLIKYALIFKLTGKKVPDQIIDRSRDRFLCTEAVRFLEQVVGKVNVGNGSPYLLAKELGVIK